MPTRRRSPRRCGTWRLTDGGKTTRVVMPQLGESVHEGTISKWLVKPGDKVVEFEPMLEVDTDKVNAEVPAPVTGILREILAKEGETVQAGAEIAVVEVGGAGRSTAAHGGEAPAEGDPSPLVRSRRRKQRTRSPTRGEVPAQPAERQPVPTGGTGAGGKATPSPLVRRCRRSRRRGSEGEDRQSAPLLPRRPDGGVGAEGRPGPGRPARASAAASPRRTSRTSPRVPKAAPAAPPAAAPAGRRRPRATRSSS